MDWYETVICHQPGQQIDDSISQDGTLVETQQDLGSAEMELDSTDVHHTQENVDFLSSRAATPRPVSNPLIRNHLQTPTQHNSPHWDQ
jgi:hypothetical protein